MSAISSEGAVDHLPEPRRIVVVLGSGRSGTSLATKILGTVGMRLDSSLHRPNEMNPDGYYEDQTIVEANRALLEALSLAPPHVPPSRRSTATAPAVLAKLRAYLDERVQAAPSIWGFKDPRTSLLLPQYRRLFQGLGIVPSFVFCARDGSSVVESLLQATSLSRAEAEQVYLSRCLMALRDCGANCYVLHYERLLQDPVNQIGRLADFVWPSSGAPSDLDEKARRAIANPALNRSALQALPLINPLARRIDALISNMEGKEFDRNFVRAELREIDQINQGYSTWLDMISAREKKLTSHANESAAAPIDYEPGTLFAGLGSSMSSLIADNNRLNRRLWVEGHTVTQLKSELEVFRGKLDDANRRPSAPTEEQIANTSALRAANETMVRQLADLQATAGRQQEDYVVAVQKARGRLNEIAQRDEKINRLENELVSAKNLPGKENGTTDYDGKIAQLERQIAREQDVCKLKQSELSDSIMRINDGLAKITDQDVVIAQLNAKLSEARGVLQTQEAQTEELRAENIAQREQLERMVALADANAAQVLSERQVAEELMASHRFRAGSALVEAVRRPGWNTIVLPWRLVRAARAASKPERSG